MFEQDGFATSARSDDGGNLTAWTIEVNTVKHLLFSEAPPQITHDDRRINVHTIVRHRLVVQAPGLRFSYSQFT